MRPSSGDVAGRRVPSHRDSVQEFSGVPVREDPPTPHSVPGISVAMATPGRAPDPGRPWKARLLDDCKEQRLLTHLTQRKRARPKLRSPANPRSTEDSARRITGNDVHARASERGGYRAFERQGRCPAPAQPPPAALPSHWGGWSMSKGRGAWLSDAGSVRLGRRGLAPPWVWIRVSQALRSARDDLN